MLQVFEHAEGALSVVELVDRLQREMNKTTVYRILDRLEDEGMLHSFTGEDGLTWYAKCEGCSPSGHLDAHPHFQCRDCGKTECLPIDMPIPSLPDHRVDAVKLLLIGQCADCVA
jgi:Fur family ferric uptake transcriptional regulator